MDMDYGHKTIEQGALEIKKAVLEAHVKFLKDMYPLILETPKMKNTAPEEIAWFKVGYDVAVGFLEEDLKHDLSTMQNRESTKNN